MVGEVDPLIDDTLAMERAWREANGNCELVVAPASPHAFNRLPTAIATKVTAYVEAWMETRLAASAAD